MTSVRDARLAEASCGDWCATSAMPVPCLPMMLVAVSQPARGREPASNKKQPTTRRGAPFGLLTKAGITFIRSLSSPARIWPGAVAWSRRQAAVSRIMPSRASQRSTSPHHRLGLHRQKPFALQFLAGQLAGPAHRLRLLAGPLFRGFLIMAAQFHLAKNALPLHLFLERLEGLINVIVANENLHAGILGEAPAIGWWGNLIGNVKTQPPRRGEAPERRSHADNRPGTICPGRPTGPGGVGCGSRGPSCGPAGRPPCRKDAGWRRARRGFLPRREHPRRSNYSFRHGRRLARRGGWRVPAANQREPGYAARTERWRRRRAARDRDYG